MQYSVLGKTGLRVSRLGFGGAVIGLDGFLSDQDRTTPEFAALVEHLVSEAMNGGINYFDTAPAYGKGHSESLLGKALHGKRDRVVLATKLFVNPSHTSKDWTHSLNASLERLQTNRVDILQVHGTYWENGDVNERPWEEFFNWAQGERASGRIKYLGITAENTSGALEALLKTEQFETLQIGCNLIYQNACDHQRDPTGIIPFAKARNIGIISMKAATSGFMQRLLSLEFPDISSERISEMCLKFALSIPEVDCSLIGMSRLEELEANLKLASDHTARYDLKDLHNRYRPEWQRT